MSWCIQSDELYHHGILGQKWGVRRYQNKDGSLTAEGIKRYSKSANIEKWGNDADHNILYITGYSGSGKSTKAQEIAKKNNAEVIHLDLYLEQVGKDSFNKDSNKSFNRYLEKHGYDRNEYLKLAYSKDPEIKKQRWKMIDELGDHITNYGKEQYGKKKVIVEGVQLSDQTIYPDKSFFNDKPVMMMQTSALKSWYRAGIRDEKINKEDLTLQDAKEYINWYSNMYKNKRNLEKQLSLKHSGICGGNSKWILYRHI